MIDHLSITVANIEKSRIFYDVALAALGATRIMNMDRPEVRISGYGRGGKPSFWIAETAEGGDALAGHVAFAAPDRGTVDDFYQAAIAAGASDNGAPGLRPHYHPDYYASFVIDPDGNRLEAVCHKPSA
jgi:catechol 2,3-dioxygenase-like lactoylglutathione lyase family enzyme